jgi:hypothetical protein
MLQTSSSLDRYNGGYNRANPKGIEMQIDSPDECFYSQANLPLLRINASGMTRHEAGAIPLRAMGSFCTGNLLQELKNE